MTSGLAVAAMVAAVLAAGGPAASALPLASGAVTLSQGVHAASADACPSTNRITETPLALDALQSDLAWQTTRGAGVLVAVVDSGVVAVPHLVDAIAGGIDLVGDGLGPYADLDGHGTAIAGQIAARPLQDSAVVGLAPEARILSVRVYAEQGAQDGGGPDIARLAAGIRAASDAGAQIIVVSLSTSVAADPLAQAVEYATGRGSLVVASGGNRDLSLSFEENESDGARYPAGVAGALGVAAADVDGDVGESSIHGPQIAVSAPGSQVTTTAVSGGDCTYADTPDGAYAAGYAAAAAALVASAHPDETPAQWAYRLEASAVRGDPDARDDVSGWGFVQPADAIALVPGPGVRGPASPFEGASLPPTAVPTETPVAIVVGPPANAGAVGLAIVGAVGAAVVLAVLATLGILLRRRRDPAAAAAGRARGDGASGGLFGADRTAPDDSL